MSTGDNNERRIEIIDDMNTEINQIIKDDYIKTTRKLTGVETSCIKLSVVLAVGAFIFTGMGSILAFAAGYFKHDYVSFAAGCSNVVAMILMKASYYAHSQGHFHDVKLRSHLTKDYRFVRDFIHDPLSLKPVNDPSMPDPMHITELDSSPSRARLSSMAHIPRPLISEQNRLSKSVVKKNLILDDQSPEVSETVINVIDPMIDTREPDTNISVEKTDKPDDLEKTPQTPIVHNTEGDIKLDNEVV